MSVKNLVAMTFICPIIKVFHFVILPILQCIKMAVFSKVKSHSDAVDYFQELSFNNKPIKKSNVKHLKNIDPLAELLFYEQLNVIKTNQALEDMQCCIKLK